jgi:diguanylate cyclase (GGDEF)-like protein
LRDGGGEWLELRTAMAGAPLHVADMAQHRVLRDNRLVLNGTVRSCAVAPVRSAEGRLVGAVGIADPRTGGIEATLLDPLVFWAERIGAGLRELERERGAGGAPEAPVSFNGGDGDAAPRTAGKSAVGEAARGLLGALDTAVMVTSGGTVAYANGRMAELLCLRNGDLRGLRRSEVLGMIASATDAAHPTLQRIANTARDPAPATVLLSFAKPLRRVLRWNTRRIRVGAQQALLEELTDVTREAEEAEAREKLVRVDAETGLPNRRAAQEALGRAMSWSLRIGMPLSVGLFAIDALSGFDPPVAAELLRSSAWILRDLLRGYDLATRYDETRLLAILPGLGAGHTARLAERYRRAVARTEVDGLPRVTVSGGMASFDGTQDADQLVEMAAAALVTAQRRGGNAVV